MQKIISQMVDEYDQRKTQPRQYIRLEISFRGLGLARDFTLASDEFPHGVTKERALDWVNRLRKKGIEANAYLLDSQLIKLTEDQ